MMLQQKVISQILICLAVTAFAGGVYSQSTPRLNSELAESIIGGCTKHASEKGQGHAIAVVDLSGSLLAFLRMNGNPPGVGEFAIEKAVAVASWGFSTAQMEDAIKSTPGFANAPKIVTVGGGVPIFSLSGSEFLGAVGVSGGSPADDAACAVAGIEAAGLRASRN